MEKSLFNNKSPLIIVGGLIIIVAIIFIVNGAGKNIGEPTTAKTVTPSPLISQSATSTSPVATVANKNISNEPFIETVYPAFCAEKLINDKCNSSSKAFNPTTYKIYSETGEVLSTTENALEVSKVTGCKVMDRDNWSCDYNDNSGGFGMRNAKFWEMSYVADSSANDSLDKTYYVSKAEWLKLPHEK